MEQGGFMDMFENMMWELCDTLFYLILGLEASRKSQSQDSRRLMNLL